MKIISNYEYNELLSYKKDNDFLKGQVERRDETIQILEKQCDSIKEKMDTMEDKFELREKKAVAALEDKLAKEIAKLEKAHNEEIMKLERDMNNDKMKELERMNKKHYDKLSESMTKLHEEGNAQTKFMQEMTQTVIKSASGFAKANNTERIEYSEE